jgi:hypothetical protein
MNLIELGEIIAHIKFRDWRFEIFVHPPMVGKVANYHSIRTRFLADGTWQNGRKWVISNHMTKSEVVQTAFKAILTAMEHEIREEFSYKGEAIFGPHFDVEELLRVAQAHAMDIREAVGG